MASQPRPEAAGSGAAPRGGWTGWALAVLGVLLALASLKAAQAVAPSIPVESIPAAYTVFYLLTFGPLILIALAFGAAGRHGVLRAGSTRWAALGLACGIGGIAVAAFYAWLSGGLVRGAPAEALSLALLILGLALTLFQVSAEELLFRGWLLQTLRGLAGVWPAVLLSAAVFSLFHALGGAQAPLSFVNLFLGGVWFALLALRSGGLLAPVAAHFAWNAVEDLGLGLVPNPGAGPLGALADWDILGPALWGGSDEGLNASLGMTVVLLALIAPLLRGVRA